MHLQPSPGAPKAGANLLPGVGALPQLHQEMFAMVLLLYRESSQRRNDVRLARLDEILALYAESFRLEESVLRYQSHPRVREHCHDHRQILWPMRAQRTALLQHAPVPSENLQRVLDALVIHMIFYDHAYSDVKRNAIVVDWPRLH